MLEWHPFVCPSGTRTKMPDEHPRIFYAVEGLPLVWPQPQVFQPLLPGFAQKAASNHKVPIACVVITGWVAQALLVSSRSLASLLPLPSSLVWPLYPPLVCAQAPLFQAPTACVVVPGWVAQALLVSSRSLASLLPLPSLLVWPLYPPLVCAQAPLFQAPTACVVVPG